MVEELLRQALNLDDKDRASLAGALIESLYGEAEPGAEEAVSLPSTYLVVTTSLMRCPAIRIYNR